MKTHGLWQGRWHGVNPVQSAFWMGALALSVLSACSGATQTANLSGVTRGVQQEEASSAPVAFAGASSSSTVESVALPMTPVESQGRIGLCWAYGTIGLVESHAKRVQGRTVNLSEEALAFYHFAHYLTNTIRTLPASDLLSFFSRGFNEGFYTRLPKDRSQSGELDALELIKRYGVVPETVWSFKFETPEKRVRLLSTLRERTYRYLLGRLRTEVTVDEVINNILVGEGGFPSRPPSEFEFEGERLKATDLTARLEFDPDAYDAVEARSEAELDTLVRAVKRTLARGESVPFGFPINISRLKGDMFTGRDITDRTNYVAFTQDGGHLVLITDFVNVNGRVGAMSKSALRFELERSSKDLSYLVFKNSWGVGAKTNEAGQSVGFSADGYYKIDRTYLEGAARAAEKGWMSTIAVVPKDIAQDPYGSEPDAQLVSSELGIAAAAATVASFPTQLTPTALSFVPAAR